MSVMIQLLNLKGVFVGLLTNNANKHIINYVGICALYNLSRVSKEAL